MEWASVAQHSFSFVSFCFSGHGDSLELLRFLELVPLVNTVLESKHAYTHSYHKSHQGQTCAGPWGYRNQKEHFTHLLKSDFE